MIINREKIWPPKKNGRIEISVGFLDDGAYDDDCYDMVRDIAGEWEDACNNITFKWKKPKRRYKKCDVRISFKASTGGSWFSQIGTDALNISDQSKPTMSLEWVDEPNKVKTDSKLKKIMRRHILHEFGHMLGAEHEQFSPYFPWQFKSTAVYEHFEAEIKKENRKRGTSWTPKQITSKANERAYRDMLKRLNEADIRYSLFDPKSIMLYYIDLDWIKHKASDKILEELRDDHGGTLKGFGNWHDLSYLDTAIVNETYADYNPYSRSGSSSDSEEEY